VGERLPAPASLLAVMLEDIAGVTKLYYRFCFAGAGEAGGTRGGIAIKAIQIAFIINLLPLRELK